MAKHEISPVNNWGDVMQELYSMRRSGFSNLTLFNHWSECDLKPLFENPFKEAKYLRRLASKNVKKRKKAQKTAEEFRDAMREVFLYIFLDELSDGHREELVAFCESTANGMLCSIIAGADKVTQHNVTKWARVNFVEELIGKPTAG